nr:TetR/AcrR family transcriptional regulator [uncultured Carboxylicivirga sp.]
MTKVGDLDIENRVFETTKELLINQGVKGWNMDELSDAVGVSKRTLYKIIGNKEDLLYKVTEKNITIDIKEKSDFLLGNSPYPERLNGFCEFITRGFDEFVLLNANHIVKEYPRIGCVVEKEKEKLNQSFATFFTLGQEQGYINKDLDVNMVAVFIQSVITYNISFCKSSIEFKNKVFPELEIIIKGIKV